MKMISIGGYPQKFFYDSFKLSFVTLSSVFMGKWNPSVIQVSPLLMKGVILRLLSFIVMHKIRRGEFKKG